MSPSRPFILRPVATSLLMAAILLVGIVAYRQLPVSALPEVDYPTIEIVTLYPGAAPGRHGLVGDRAARAPVRANPWAQADDINELVRQLRDHAAVRSQARHRCGGTGSPGGDQRRVARSCQPICPIRPSTAKSNPADAPVLTLALTSDHAPAAAGAVPCRYAPGAEDLAAPGRRPRHDQRRAEAGRSRSRESDGAGGLRLEPDVGSAGDPSAPT